MLLLQLVVLQEDIMRGDAFFEVFNVPMDELKFCIELFNLVREVIVVSLDCLALPVALDLILLFFCDGRVV